MKITITGALGHIGSRLIREIPKVFPNSQIQMIDNFLTMRYCSLFNLDPEVNYNFIETDIMKADLVKLFEGSDVVVHLAAITDAASSFDNPQEVENINFEGTKLVAQACAKTNVPLIFLSTTSVYGVQEELVDETCTIDKLKPQSPYAESKLKAEEYLAMLGNDSGLKYIILRFGTIFGISQGIRFHTAVNKFCWQACMSTPITVWKTAVNQKRPYLDLEDGVRALTFIIEKKLYNCSIYNVLTLNATVNDILTEINTHIKDIKIDYVDSKIMNQLSYNVSSTKFTDVGFEFSGSLKRGIDDTINLLFGINRREV